MRNKKLIPIFALLMTSFIIGMVTIRNVSATNYIQNGTFEGSFDYWTLREDRPASLSPDAFNGYWSAVITWQETTESSWYPSWIIQDITDVDVADLNDDAITFYSKSETIHRWVKVQVWYSAMDSDFFECNPSTSWQKQTISKYDLDAGKTVIKIAMIAEGEQDAQYHYPQLIDNVQINSFSQDSLQRGTFEGSGYWSYDDASRQVGSKYAGSYGCQLCEWQWIAYFGGSITQDILYRVNDLSTNAIKFYMKSASMQIKVTVYYGGGTTDTFTFGTSGSWIQRTITKAQLDANKDITTIKIEALGYSLYDIASIDNVYIYT